MGITLGIRHFVTNVNTLFVVTMSMSSACIDFTRKLALMSRAQLPVLLVIMIIYIPGAEVSAQQSASEPDLQVTKTVDNAAPDAPDQTIEFAIRVENVSEATAADVVLEDKLPRQLIIPEVMAPVASSGTYNPSNGLWRISEIAPGEAELLTVPAFVNAAPQPACIVNRAELVISDAFEFNNYSVAVIRRPDVPRCIDLTPSWNRPIFGDNFCGGEQSISYELRVHNRSRQEAQNVTLTLSETSDFKMPGLRLTSPNCSGLECTWASIPPYTLRSVTAESRKFRNGQEHEHRIQLVVRSTDPDYEPDNDTYTVTRRITSFGNPCQSYGVPEPTLPFGGGGSGGGGCFIATAAYGTAFDARIEILRRFRDEWLMPNALGRSLVHSYYELSPPVAAFIEPRPLARAAVRVLLLPILVFVTYPVLCLSGFLAGIVLLGWRLRSRSGRVDASPH